MDFRSSKTKLLKKSHETRTKWPKNTSENYPISEKDLNDLETLPVIDAMKTPQRNNHRKMDFSSNSPQFRVGWNDGFDSSVLPGAESPIVPSVQQRIRRCPDELYKDIKKNVCTKNLEIERDRHLGCVTWAKNLLEISLEPQKNSPSENIGTPTDRNEIDTPEDSVSIKRSRESLNDDHIDIADDSVDELMILCSQAVEEKVIGKRPLISESRQPKKQKRAESFDGPSVVAESTGESGVNKVLHFGQKNVIATTASKTDTVKKSDKLVDSMDLFKCALDDDDEFSSFDLNYLDSIQNLHSQNNNNNNNNNYCSIPKPNFNGCNPKPKYTKEQIEQRRLEAKKKLLFKKKHKSM